MGSWLFHCSVTSRKTFAILPCKFTIFSCAKRQEACSHSFHTIKSSWMNFIRPWEPLPSSLGHWLRMFSPLPYRKTHTHASLYWGLDMLCRMRYFVSTLTICEAPHNVITFSCIMLLICILSQPIFQWQNSCFAWFDGFDHLHFHGEVDLAFPFWWGSWWLNSWTQLHYMDVSFVCIKFKRTSLFKGGNQLQAINCNIFST